MSYILDALRKSEQERLRGKLPDLKNFGDEDKRIGGNYRLAWIIGGALLALNAVGISVWLLRTPPETGDVATAPALNSESATSKDSSPATGTQGSSSSAPPSIAGSAASIAPSAAVNTPGAASSTQVGNAAAAGAVTTVPVVQGTPVTTPAPTAVVTTAPPPGTVYYVTQGSAVPGQQIVVLPSGVMPGSVVQGGVVQGGVVQGGVLPGAQGGNVVVMPSANQPAVQSWDSSGVAMQPPPPAPPPPPPVNLDETLDAAGVGATPAISYLPQLDELPAHIRQQVPDMAFSSHMFSSMAKFRSVVINGNRVKEGQMVGDNIQVREITETGVILSLGETQFQVDVLGKWSQ